MKQKINFSVIVPVKNEENNLKKLLKSIFDNHYNQNSFEVIIVDNGSTDSTVSVAEKYPCRIFIKPDATISTLRNLGSLKAKGDVLAFIDADCTVSDDWLSSASKYVDQDNVVCFGNPPAIPKHATWVQKAWYQVRVKPEGCSEVIWLESMNMFVRRDVFLRVGGFNEDLVTCEDYDLSLRLSREGTILCDSSITAVHHGEARDLKQFFRKEVWRGSSNWKGAFSHGIQWRELPSLLMPVVHSLLLALLIVLILTAPFFGGALVVLCCLVLLLLIVPSFLYAWKKLKFSYEMKNVLQLTILLNVYFLARSFSLVKSKG